MPRGNERMPKVGFTPHLLIDIEHWRERAEEARIRAETLKDPVAKRTMNEIAACYDRLVDAAEWSLEHFKSVTEV
jgi:hypothetical protein